MSDAVKQHHTLATTGKVSQSSPSPKAAYKKGGRVAKPMPKMPMKGKRG